MTLWRHRDFMRLWTAETISQLGTQVTLVAMPFAAIKTLHATTFEVGALTAVQFAPFVLVGLPAGVWVDRLPRRPILVAGDAGRALVLGSVPIAYALGALTLVHLYVAAFLAGVLTVFFDVAYQSYLPALVQRDHLVEGNAKLELSRSGAVLAGPAIAGVLVGAVHAPPSIAVDALSFVASALFILAIRGREPRTARTADEHRDRVRTEVAVGLRYVLGHRYLRAIAACTGTSNLFSSMLEAVLLLYLVRGLDMGAGVIGVVLAIGNAGMLLGALSAARLARRFGVGPVILGAAALTGPTAALVPLAPHASPIPFLVAWGLAFSFGSTVYNINQVSLRQTITPERLLGRMNATMRFLVWGTMPLGGVLGGALGAAIGLRGTLWIATVGASLAFVPIAVSSLPRLGAMPSGPDDDVGVDEVGGSLTGEHGPHAVARDPSHAGAGRD